MSDGPTTERRRVTWATWLADVLFDEGDFLFSAEDGALLVEAGDPARETKPTYRLRPKR